MLINILEIKVTVTEFLFYSLIGDLQNETVPVCVRANTPVNFERTGSGVSFVGQRVVPKK